MEVRGTAAVGAIRIGRADFVSAWLTGRARVP